MAPRRYPRFQTSFPLHDTDFTVKVSHVDLISSGDYIDFSGDRIFSLGGAPVSQEGNFASSVEFYIQGSSRNQAHISGGATSDEVILVTLHRNR